MGRNANMVDRGLCPICSRPLFALFVDATTFGGDAPTWVEAEPYCPNCMEQAISAELRIWREHADDLYQAAIQHPAPVPQTVINAVARYERTRDGRF
jgi:hypothetical protein